MKYISTRDDKKEYSAEQVLNFGLAPDGGLFIPNEIPKFSNNQINALKGKNYFEIANFILTPFLSDLFDAPTIKKIIEEAYSKFDKEIVTISNIGDNDLLNLFHGSKVTNRPKRVTAVTRPLTAAPTRSARKRAIKRSLALRSAAAARRSVIEICAPQAAKSARSTLP